MHLGSGKLFLTALSIGACVFSLNAAAVENVQKQILPANLNQLGIRQIQQQDPNLLGEDCEIALIARSFTYIKGQPQNDYRPNNNHIALENAELTFSDDESNNSGTSPHSTAICSILAGNDPNAFNNKIGSFHYQGILPNAKLRVYEFWHFLTKYAFYNKAPEADVITAGFGSQFEDWWTNALDKLAQSSGIVLVASIGNGINAYDPPLYPAALPNTIGVGLINPVNSENVITKINNYALSYPENSTCGPTIDNRCKPDIVAPGFCFIADHNDNLTYKPSRNGTSFATPIVAGTASIILQKAKTDPNCAELLNNYPKNCFVKAILLNSAEKLPLWHKGKISPDDDHIAPLDHIQGAGMINPKGAFNTLTAGRSKPGSARTTGWDMNLIKNKANAKLYRFEVNEPNDKIISGTLAWNYNYEPEYPFSPLPERNQNLRLELWAVNLQEPEQSYLLDYSDSEYDNLEHIYHKADPNYQTYEIIVSHSQFDQNDFAPLNQQYAVAWNAGPEDSEDSIYSYDLNADGIVNDSDAFELLDNWTKYVESPEYYFLGDINSDGRFDGNDFNMLVNNKGRKARWYKGSSDSTPKE